MRLIPNASRVALRAHSMWAIWLGILCLWAPDAIYLLSGVDTSPRVWFVGANLLFAYGIVGRLIDQGLSR